MTKQNYHGRNHVCTMDKTFCNFELDCKDCKIAIIHEKSVIRERSRKATLIFTGAMVTLVTVVTPASAVSGVGDIVYDPSNYAQNLESAIQAVKQVENQYVQIQNQFTQLANEAKNLTGDHTNIAGLRTAFQNLITMNNYIKGLIADYTRAQAAWDRTYPKFSTYNGNLSASDYANHVAQAWQNTNAALLNSATGNAIVVSNRGITKAAVDDLLASSDTAAGALQAAQIGHKLAVAQVEQLAELTQIVAQSADAQVSYSRYQMDKDDQAQKEADSMQQLQNINNPSSTGVGELIPSN
jgi:P-type conjugative transfer protein TrbJ